MAISAGGRTFELVLDLLFLYQLLSGIYKIHIRTASLIRRSSASRYPQDPSSARRFALVALHLLGIMVG